MRKIRRWLSILVTVTLSMGMLYGCGSAKDTPAQGESDAAGGKNMKFAMISRITGNPYEEKQLSGFADAIEELGYEAITKAPEAPTAEAQIQMIEDLINQKVDGIAVVCNDPEALSPVLKKAIKKGIKVISIDGPAPADARMIHVNQADSEGVGRMLVKAVSEMMEGEGQFAILSATAQSAEQNVWIDWMKEELKDPKYDKIELVKTVYGDDLRDKSISEMEGLLKSYPDLKAVVAPTTVGMAACGKVITDKDLIGKIKLTGLGLPSEMAEYITNGACPYMYLWNPIDNGYLAGQTAYALAAGQITGAYGDTFTAGRLGEKSVITIGDGTEVTLGEPFEFNPENIEEWKDVY